MKTQCEGLGGAACRRQCRPATIRTLAYVVSECRVDAAGFVGHQALRVRRGDDTPVTIAEFSTPVPLPDTIGLCRLYGENRQGSASAVIGAVQRLSVSPDGIEVVFEVTDDFTFFPFTNVPPEQEGLFIVRTDGSGLRRLGPASRDPSFRIAPSVLGDFNVFGPSAMPFSPDGRTLAFSDLGPGPTGEEAIQIVALDLATGKRTQLTHMPSGTSPYLTTPVTCCPVFVDDRTVVFNSFLDPDGSNPQHDFAAFTVKIDGSGFEAVPVPVVVPGSRLVPTFGVAGRGTNLVDLTLPGRPVNSYPDFATEISEVFLQDGKNLLQLTSFHRVDTLSQFLSVGRRRAFFTASADPLGTNPSQNCQLFSVDGLGAHLRQVTHFNRGEPIGAGCFSSEPPGCFIREGQQDPATGTVVFYSACDPFGTNPKGGQVFAMRPDGAGLRQLTDARGFTLDADGTVSVELPGPFAYSATGVH